MICKRKRRAKITFAAIRELFEEFSARLQDAWNLDEEVMINETLRKFCSRCQFKIHNSAKPGKNGTLFCGIIFPRYIFKMTPYTGLLKNEESALAHKEANKVGIQVHALTVGI